MYVDEISEIIREVKSIAMISVSEDIQDIKESYDQFKE